jgi:uncharacterized membrane protein
MIFAPLGCLAAILLFLSIPFILLLVFLNVLSFSFGELGLSASAALWLILAMLMGSLINIPLSRRPITYTVPSTMKGLFAPPPPQYSGIAVNVGGAIIPLCLSIYLATLVPSLWQVGVATAVMALVSKVLARVVPGRGIVLPVFVPPLLSALLGIVLAPGFAAPCAYVAGTAGTLIGADLLNLHRLRGFPGVVSIGGAGVFDGIFLVGIVAVLLTALVQ